MSRDRSWMQHRIPENGVGVTPEFRRGIDEFLDFAYTHAPNLHDGKVRCPCSHCALRFFLTRDEIAVHLCRRGFIYGYNHWTSHGESSPVVGASASGSVGADVAMEEDNPYRTMVMDAAGPEFELETSDADDVDALTPAIEEPPNAEAARFYELLQAANEPLYEGCKQSHLSAMIKFLNLKSDYNMPESGYDRMIQFARVNILPKAISVGTSRPHKISGFGESHNWVKQSIFWELPYWSSILIRHNLDVMHIEKNVFDNVFNTVLDVKGKTKDNAEE